MQLSRRQACNSERIYVNWRTSTLIQNHTHALKGNSKKAGSPLLIFLHIPNPGMTAIAERAVRNSQTGWHRCHRLHFPWDQKCVSCLFIVLWKSQLRNLLDLIHRWWKCMTGITKPIFLRSSRNTDVTSWKNPGAEGHGTGSEICLDKLSIRHLKTNPRF